MSIGKAFLTIAVNSEDFQRSMVRAMEVIQRLTVSFHHGGVHFGPNGLTSAGRCDYCHPNANPRPLTIDGHAYARRRNARRGRR